MREPFRRAAGLLCLAVLGLAFLAHGSTFAFDAALAPDRATAAEVVPHGSAYHALTPVVIHASTDTGYAGQEGLVVANHGTDPATFTWTTTSDPAAVEAATLQCAAPTAVGAACSVRFDGAARAAGTYTFTGRVEGDAGGMRSSAPGIQVEVRYCAAPPCA